MLEFGLQPENLPFAVALGLIVIVGLLEAAGLGSAAVDIDLPDVDADVADAPDGFSSGAPAFLSFLGLGRVPLLIWLLVFLASFALVGLVGQRILLAVTGDLLTPWLAGPAAALLALPLAGQLAAVLARILPQDESTAVSIEELIGRHAEVVIGTARQGSPARAKVRDRHGQLHHVMVEPESNGEHAVSGERLLLTSRDGDLFRGILDASTRLPGISTED